MSWGEGWGTVKIIERESMIKSGKGKSRFWGNVKFIEYTHTQPDYTKHTNTHTHKYIYIYSVLAVSRPALYLTVRF